MKLLHVIPSIEPSQGGLRSGTLLTCRAQQAAGMKTEIACLEGQADGIVVHRFKPGLRPVGASAGMRDWLLEHAGAYDAIIAHVVWLNPAHYAAKAAAKAGVPLYLASRGMLDPDALAHHRLRKLVRWHTGVRKLISRSVLVFSSQADMKRSMSLLGSTPAVVIPNAVEAQRGQAPFSTANTEPDPVGPITCLNRLHPRKGVLEWVRALGQLRRPFKALHAGHAEDAAYAARIMREAEPLVREGLLEFRGAVDHAGALALIAQGGMVVHPATGFENFGNVIVEAMAAGRPVVASRRALVTPELEQAGMVIGTEPQPDALARAMGSLLAEPARAAALGKAAREYAIRHFSIEAVGQRWREVLKTGTGLGKPASI